MALLLALPALIFIYGSNLESADGHSDSSAPRDRPVVKQLATSAKVAALTFDDGPDPRFTPRILDELKRRGIKATFFVIGEQVALYPALARRLVTEGHVLANHSYTHPQLERMPERVVSAELESCDEAVRRLGAPTPTFFRAPRGNLSPTIFRVGQRRGYTIINWTVCADHHDAPTPKDMARRVLDHVRPGMIVLIHDGRMKIRELDVQALPLIIDGLEKLDYRFVTLDRKWLR